MQMLHPAKVLVTLCVELPLLSLIDSSVMGVVCFTHLWKRGLRLQTPHILLLKLIRSCGLDLDCLRVAAVFGSIFFGCTDWVVLPDDAAGHSSTLVDWGWICATELGCKAFGMCV